jgi:hypothetical protein
MLGLDNDSYSSGSKMMVNSCEHILQTDIVRGMALEEFSRRVLKAFLGTEA